MGKEIRLGASAVVKVLRDAYMIPGTTRSKEHAALMVGAQVMPGVDDAKVLAIAKGKATLRGFTPHITYHDVPCTLCKGKGGLDNDNGRDCPTCGGDGFSPPIQPELHL